MEITKPDAARWVKAIIFGPYGHGKTTFCATAQLDPRTSPALFLDFEAGESSLAGLDIDMHRIRSWDDYNEAYAELNDNSKYKSIIIDSISETHIFALLAIVEKFKSRREDPDLVQLQDYGKAQIQMRRFLRAFRDLPMHVFMTCQSKDVTEPKVGTVKKVALAGQMAEEVPGIMDVVAYLALRETDKGETERVLLLKNQPQFRVKVRTPWGVRDVPDELAPDPTVTDLLNALKVPMLNKTEGVKAK